MSDEFRLDYGVLDGAVTRLASVTEYLHSDAMSRSVQLSSTDAGSDDIVNALDDFHRAWSDARGKTRESVEAASSFLSAASNALREVERQMVDGLNGTI